MIDRRSALAGLALVCVVRQAQAAGLPVVYFMALATRESDAASIAAFRAGMRERGHVEGRSYVLLVQLAAKRVQLLAEAELSRELGLAVIAEERRYADAGALMSYGASDQALFEQAAGFVHRILAGSVPSEMPVQLPTRFELVINLNTAATLGLKIPQSMLLLADEIIR